MPQVYSLTDVTGKNAKDERTRPVLTFMVRRTTLVKLAWSLIPTVVALMATVGMLGVYSLILAGCVMAGFYGLVSFHSRNGMQETLLKTAYAKYTDKPGVVFLTGGIRVDLDHPRTGIIAHAATMSPDPESVHVRLPRKGQS
ncbi:hypothetical protein [Changpingibacter yushuensis]|uniref:hypothetical protein n=1 Tax=Changpingibacter yushuensis TaxID=2758440 RepID=UPI0015F749F1|nr:hypothetical protein [Changpingibacter yushuensis]